MENIIEIKELCEAYSDFALKNVSFALPKGYIMGFVGQNGSGKTTTIRSIMNMTKVDSGSIGVFGLDSVRDTIAIKQRLGVVFDSMYLDEYLTAKQIERQIRPFYKNWNSKDFFDSLKQFSLTDNRAVGDFSKGMKMKLMITIALAYKPELLIGVKTLSDSSIEAVISSPMSSAPEHAVFDRSYIAEICLLTAYVLLAGEKNRLRIIQ